jgi:hypothetical protein
MVNVPYSYGIVAYRPHCNLSYIERHGGNFEELMDCVSKGLLKISDKNTYSLNFKPGVKHPRATLFLDRLEKVKRTLNITRDEYRLLSILAYGYTTDRIFELDSRRFKNFVYSDKALYSEVDALIAYKSVYTQPYNDKGDRFIFMDNSIFRFTKNTIINSIINLRHQGIVPDGININERCIKVIPDLLPIIRKCLGGTVNDELTMLAKITFRPFMPEHLDFVRSIIKSKLPFNVIITTLNHLLEYQTTQIRCPILQLFGFIDDNNNLLEKPNEVKLTINELNISLFKHMKNLKQLKQEFPYVTDIESDLETFTRDGEIGITNKNLYFKSCRNDETDRTPEEQSGHGSILSTFADIALKN